MDIDGFSIFNQPSSDLGIMTQETLAFSPRHCPNIHRWIAKPTLTEITRRSFEPSGCQKKQQLTTLWLSHKNQAMMTLKGIHWLDWLDIKYLKWDATCLREHTIHSVLQLGTGRQRRSHDDGAKRRLDLPAGTRAPKKPGSSPCWRY